jgi:hypothetical protein
MPLTRRQVLAAMGATAALGAGASGVALKRSVWDLAPAEGLLALSDGEYRFVQALAEAWMPAGGDPALSGADADLGRFVDDIVFRTLPTNRKLLKALFQGLDQLPMLTHARSFSALDLPVRTAVLQGWLDSDVWLLRQGVGSVVVFLAFGWTTHPDVVGYLAPSFICRYGR